MTYERILPALQATYGAGAMVDSLAEHLAARIDDGGLFERQIVNICWDWFPGGGTAQIAGRRVTDALRQTADDDLSFDGSTLRAHRRKP